jgi:putative endonuclease
MPWRVYIVECKDGKLYTGITNNLLRRINEHNSGNGSRFTKYRLPVRLLYAQKVSGRSEALKREARIKHLSRPQKFLLIKSDQANR